MRRVDGINNPITCSCNLSVVAQDFPCRGYSILHELFSGCVQHFLCSLLRHPVDVESPESFQFLEAKLHRWDLSPPETCCEQRKLM